MAVMRMGDASNRECSIAHRTFDEFDANHTKKKKKKIPPPRRKRKVKKRSLRHRTFFLFSCKANAICIFEDGGSSYG